LLVRNYFIAICYRTSFDIFLLVCTSLISNGEQQDEETVGGQRRPEALRMLCEMCPSQALTIRALCVSNIVCEICALAKYQQPSSVCLLLS